MTYMMWPLLLALTTLMPVSFCNTTAMWDLPAPTNVRIDSYNMKHILKWDPVLVPSTVVPMMYRVECQLIGVTCLMCENITETQCDFTDKVKPFWRGRYQVRAELGEWRSAWAEATNGEFQPSIHTKIAVQTLSVETHANSVTVDFSPPFSPIPEAFKLKYWLYYWKEGTDHETEVPLGVQTHYILEKLEDQTVYCVQVKAATDRIDGQKSDPKCAQTMTRDYTGKELAVIVVCVIIACGICSVAGFIIYNNNNLIKRLLYPPFRMPYHIQEFLESPQEQPHAVEFDPSHIEEHCDGVSVIELTFFLEDSQMCADPNLVPAEKT